MLLSGNFKRSLLVLLLLIPLLARATPSVDYSPYVDLSINTHWNFLTQSIEPMDLIKISNETGIKNYHLAFINDASHCKPAWAGQSSYPIDKAWGKKLTDSLQKQGIKYTVAFGGSVGNDMSKYCSEAELVTVYSQVIRTYQPDKLDFDIENGTADVIKMMKALKKIQHLYPTIKLSFTLPVMPDGLVTEGENIVKRAQLAKLNFSINIMTMSYGPDFNNDMGHYATQAATHLFQFLKKRYPEKTSAHLWKMIEVTPMIGVNDTATEKFTLNNVDTLRHFANQHRLGGLASWSIARDFPCTDNIAHPTCSGENLQTKPYEFAKRFLAM